MDLSSSRVESFNLLHSCSQPPSEQRWHRGWNLLLISERVLLLRKLPEEWLHFLFVLDKKTSLMNIICFLYLQYQTFHGLRVEASAILCTPFSQMVSMPPCLGISEKVHTSVAGASTLYVIFLDPLFLEFSAQHFPMTSYFLLP